ncbi:MAG: hypothetical protein IKU43_10465 [Clostridia bacterium]|nr:hypothetical protein [Clostridia bacterium]
MDNRNADAEYYRKSATVLHTVRYAVLLALVLLIVIGFTSFKKELTYDNLRYIMRYANFNISHGYSDTNSLTYSADEGSLYGYLKGDLAMLSSKGFRTYDFSGSSLIYEKLSFVNPTMKTAGKYALCFDVAGTSLELYNSYTNIESKQFDYGIKDAAVRSDGSYAVATAAKHIRSKVSVFEDDGEFSYETRDKEIVAVSLPENTDKVNFVALTVDNGDFRFLLMSYNTRNEKPVVEKEFVGEFPLKLFSTEDMMCVLTDRSLHFVDYEGNTVKRFDHASDNLSGFYSSGNFVALTYTRSVSDVSTLRIFRTDGTEIKTEELYDNILSFCAYKDTVYALEKGSLHVVETAPESEADAENARRLIEVDGVYTDVFASAEDEYILVSPFGAVQISK